MRVRKTHQSYRQEYRYQYQLGERIYQEVLVAGEKGITLTHIAQLHALDDAEVYNNLKNACPKWESWQLPGVQAWMEQHPHEKKPKNWNVSLEALLEETGEDGCGDKGRILARVSEMEEEESPWQERLHQCVEGFPPLWQEIYTQHVCLGYPMSHIAARRGVSEAAVRKVMGKIKRSLAQDEKLKKVWIGGSNG